MESVPPAPHFEDLDGGAPFYVNDYPGKVLMKLESATDHAGVILNTVDLDAGKLLFIKDRTPVSKFYGSLVEEERKG